jgi:hypothetical protein
MSNIIWRCGDGVVATWVPVSEFQQHYWRRREGKIRRTADRSTFCKSVFHPEVEKRAFAAVGLLTLVFQLFLSPAFGTTLFSYTISQGGSQPGQVTSMTFPTQYDGFSHYYQNAIFLNDSFTQADIGETVSITPESDPNFNAFASEMTDGVPESIVFWFLPAPAVNISGQVESESNVIWGDQNDPRIDLQGDAIDSFSLTLDSLQVNNSEDSSSFEATITLSATGVPEPATSSLLLILVGGMGGRRFGRRCKPPTAGRP